MALGVWGFGASGLEGLGRGALGSTSHKSHSGPRGVEDLHGPSALDQKVAKSAIFWVPVRRWGGLGSAGPLGP